MIPFIDLKAQFAALETDIRARMDAVLAHGNFIMGPEVAELEQALAAYAGAPHCVTCANGTDALLMALMAWGVGPGDAVFTTPFTFIATAEVVTLLGATPVYVDIDPVTFNLDPTSLAKAMDAVEAGDPSIYPLPAACRGKRLRPRAVISVDLFGLPADYPLIEALCAEGGLLLLEDAAQGFGGELNGKKACAFGHAATTSFFPAKPLGCYGDGGAVFTADPDTAAVLKSIRVHGKGSHKYDNARLGLNARLDTLQAAILLPKLAAFPQELAARRQAADRYAAGLAGVPGVTAPTVPAGYGSSWAQYSVMLDADRDKVAAGLKARGVPSAVYYPCPLHLQTAYAHLGYARGDMPVSEDCSARILSLPMHPYLDQATQDTVCKAVAEAVAEARGA
ncbi:MAG: DegT/DnrJ/EryC1/StrS family aminotransferase [Thermodesulfobacteriota bacterium]